MESTGDIIYRVNSRDEIVFTNEEWDRFALANGGGKVTSANILHRSLWDFIFDPTTRQLYHDILTQIRNNRVIGFRFRCDSPGCRRLMEMRIFPAEGATVEFRIRTLSIEHRQHQPLLESQAVHSEKFLRMCSWCKKINVEGTWMEVEEAVRHLRLFESTSLPMLTHGVCETCYGEMTRIYRAS
jgi:hypothetical protein